MGILDQICTYHNALRVMKQGTLFSNIGTNDQINMQSKHFSCTFLNSIPHTRLTSPTFILCVKIQAILSTSVTRVNMNYGIFILTNVTIIELLQCLPIFVSINDHGICKPCLNNDQRVSHVL